MKIWQVLFSFLSTIIPIVTDIDGGKKISREMTFSILSAILALSLGLGWVSPADIANIDLEVLNDSGWQIVEAMSRILGMFGVGFFLNLSAKRHRLSNGNTSYESAGKRTALGKVPR